MRIMTAQMAHRLIALRGLIPIADQYETEKLKELCEELEGHMKRVTEIQASIKALAEEGQ